MSLFKNRDRNFLLLQGFAADEPTSCSSRYGALQFQPRVVGVIFFVGILTQWWWLFLLLSAALWVGVARPERNLFEALYRKTLGKRPGAEAIPPTPTPRRFAQGMAATFALLISLCLFFRRPLWAYLLEMMMAVALGLLLFAGFCAGAYVYYMFRGQAEHAKKYLPWSD